MMGIPIARQRDMMDEALDVIVRLLRGEEVSHDSDWFKLNRARLQMSPYSRPSVDIAVASQVSPTGARAAGRHGVGLLSIGATSDGGFNALASNWAIAEELAKDNGKTMDRAAWRLVGPDAHRRDQGAGDGRRPLRAGEVALLLPRGRQPAAGADRAMATRSRPSCRCRWPCVGTPDEAAAKIQALIDQSGGFGCFLFMAHNWAPWAQTKRSYELFARYVAPQFQSLNVGREASMAWVKDNKADFTAQSMAAVGARIAQHAQEKGAENINPMIAAMMGLKKEEAAE